MESFRLIILTFMGILFTFQLSWGRWGPPPGGDGDWVRFKYTVTVKDPANNPLNGVSLRMTSYYYLREQGEWNAHFVSESGSTNSSGTAELEKWVDVTGYYPEDYTFNYMTVEITDPEYTIFYSENTTSQYPVNSASFVAVWDLDGDSLDDNIELSLAQKFSPVFHKQSLEKQQGFQNIDYLISNYGILYVYNNLGQIEYNNSTPPLHKNDTWQWCTYGIGQQPIYVKIDFDDSKRYNSVPIGDRPLYFHCYKDGDYYYLQYWYFFTMNDIRNQTYQNTYHEGDFEHVSIKVNASYEPVAVNFYRHGGGRTIEYTDCWWSPTNSTSYSGLQRDYNSNRTHLHIWLAANSHSSYNRYEYVYHIYVSPSVISNGENYTDNVDFSNSSNDLYFEYDYIENLGEYEQSPLKQSSNGYYYPYAHGYFWFEHNIPRKFSKDWLCFRGLWGGQWWYVNTTLPDWDFLFFKGVIQVAPPVSPIFQTNNGDHEWNNFSIDYSQNGFGFEPESGAQISWIIDPAFGD